MQARPIRVLQIDPSGFTPPYDAALTNGLMSAGCDTTWSTRPLRPGESDEFETGQINRHFYSGVDRNPLISSRFRSIAKGLSHLSGLLRLVRDVYRNKFDIIHFQWAVVPFFDAMAIRLMRRRVPVVLTVHDTTPFNGDRFSRLQSGGFDDVIRAVDHVIVHTRSALDTLVERGHDDSRISVIPHGPLGLRTTARNSERARDPRWTFVLFGQIKPYKGLPLLVEACAALPFDVRRRMRIIVAGEAQMNLDSVRTALVEFDLTDVFELRLGRLTEQEMADLFLEADAFVFPYSQIDASGVYYLVKGEGKWIVATRVGIFAEDIADGEAGRLVAPGDVVGLASALTEAAEHRSAPTGNVADTSWASIGQMTRGLYGDLLSDHRSGAHR